MSIICREILHISHFVLIHFQMCIRDSSTYGTQRINAYEIIETTLNLKDVRIFDYQYDEEGRRIAVLNKKETAIAQSKQELIKDAFAEWIWKDPDRREAICKTYNILFNSNRCV